MYVAPNNGFWLKLVFRFFSTPGFCCVNTVLSINLNVKVLGFLKHWVDFREPELQIRLVHKGVDIDGKKS